VHTCLELLTTSAATPHFETVLCPAKPCTVLTREDKHFCTTVATRATWASTNHNEEVERFDLQQVVVDVLLLELLLAR
jgi:hypothetical protein